MRDFFKKEGGSVAVSEALCITHRVDIRKHNQSKLFLIRYIDFKIAKRMRQKAHFETQFWSKQNKIYHYVSVVIANSDKATKVFTETFVESVKTLYEASLAGKEMRLKAFKHFVNEFGKDRKNSFKRILSFLWRKKIIFPLIIFQSFPLALTTPPSPRWALNSP